MNELNLLSMIENKLNDLSSPDDELPSIEDLIFNLNVLIGYFMAQESPKSVNTIWWAEQIIKGHLNQ